MPLSSVVPSCNSLKKMRDGKRRLCQNSYMSCAVVNSAHPKLLKTMDIAEWRRKIDELDRQLVALINQRAHCAEEIGKLKRNSSIPIYEPDRERIIFENIQRENRGPLTAGQLRQVYEGLVDVSRPLQHAKMDPRQW